jgi:hypothetical protein
MVVLLQRVGIPGVPNIGMLTLLVLGWVFVAYFQGVVVLHRQSVLWFLVAAVVTGAAMLVQSSSIFQAQISVTSWLLVLAVWAPFTVRLVDPGLAGYLVMLRLVTYLSIALATASLAMLGSQLAGLAFRDWFASVVPEAFQLDGFNTVAPTAYGSELIRSTAWIGLEPSVVSAFLGLGMLAAIFVRARMWVIVVIGAGLLATVSGSGVVMALLGILVILVHPCRRLLVRYSGIGLGATVVATLSPIGTLMIDRATEFQSANSSTNLRALEPYVALIPQWTDDLWGLLLGWGPGSSQRVVNDTNISGLLVPSPAKVFFDYGLIAGVVLTVFILSCYWGGPSRTFALSLVLSLWILQPGVSTSVFVAPVLAFVTLWSPRPGAPLELVDVNGLNRHLSLETHASLVTAPSR